MKTSCFVKFASNDQHLKTGYICQKIDATDPLYLDLQDNEIKDFMLEMINRIYDMSPRSSYRTYRFSIETEDVIYYECEVHEIKDNIAKINFERAGFK